MEALELFSQEKSLGNEQLCAARFEPAQIYSSIIP
jgi:hypothetical protein